MEHKELTEKIIGCTYEIYNRMGFGYLESVYEKCLLIELEKAGLSYTSQEPIPVTYDGVAVGNFIADIVVENIVIIELKSVKRIAQAHEVQLVNYLVATNLNIGLIINFSDDRVEIKRKQRKL